MRQRVLGGIVILLQFSAVTWSQDKTVESEARQRLCNTPYLNAYCFKLAAGLRLGVNLQTRIRFENRDDADIQPNLGLMRNRLMLEGDWKGLGAKLEWIDAREAIAPEEQRRQTNPFDIVQAHLYWQKMGGSDWNLRVGRQTINVGSKRLIAAPIWKNTVRSFEAIRLQGNASWVAIDAFAGRRVIIESDKFDRWSKGEVLWGVSAQGALLPDLALQTYFFGLNPTVDNAISEDGQQGSSARYTPGFRLNFKWMRNLSLEWEGMFQFGHLSNDSILAFSSAIDLGYQLQVDGQPRFDLLYTIASGDSDPDDGVSNTFVPLFASVHKYMGHLDLFRAQNVHELALVNQMQLLQGLSLRLAAHVFWLYTTRDHWYNTSGKKVRDARVDPMPGGMVGGEVDGRLRWSIFPYWTLELGGGVFISRRDPAPKRDAFVWVQTQFHFGVLGQG